MAMNKEQFRKHVEGLGVKTKLDHADTRLTQSTKVKESWYSNNGIEEDVMLGVDPQLDKLIMKNKEAHQDFWRTNGDIYRYLKTKIED